MNCKECGAEISEHDQYCQRCGAQNPNYVKIEETPNIFDSNIKNSADDSFIKETSDSSFDPFNEKNNWDHTNNNKTVSNNSSDKKESKKDSVVGIGILSFLIPVAGFILYFTLKKTDPKSASAALTWAWIGVALYFLLYFVV